MLIIKDRGSSGKTETALSIALSYSQSHYDTTVIVVTQATGKVIKKACGVLACSFEILPKLIRYIDGKVAVVFDNADTYDYLSFEDSYPVLAIVLPVDAKVDMDWVLWHSTYSTGGFNRAVGIDCLTSVEFEPVSLDLENPGC